MDKSRQAWERKQVKKKYEDAKAVSAAVGSRITAWPKTWPKSKKRRQSDR